MVSRIRAFSVSALLLLSGFISVSYAAPHVSSAPAPVSPPSSDTSLKNRLAEVETALAHAKTETETQILWEKAENLRRNSLNGATIFLLKITSEKEKEGNIQEIESLLSTALSLQPNNSLLRRLRAEARLNGNDPTGAVQDIAVALQIDQDDPISWLLLAQAQETLHKPFQALHAIKELIKRVPLLPGKDKLLKHFEQQAFGQEN